MTLPFSNRIEAGRLLAKELSHYRGRRDVLVLGLPRGGVPVAWEVARALNAPMDVLIVRKLGAPGYEELALGAVATGGVRVLSPMSRNAQLSAAIEAATERELHELKRREHAYRRGRSALDVEGLTVIVVDDGLATGSTMLAAVRSLRLREAKRIIVAVPVAPGDACDEVATEADEVICLASPEPFEAVGVWYEDFAQVSDEEVQRLLAQSTEQAAA